jgi:nitrous oxide reductase accessory protein NosL
MKKRFSILAVILSLLLWLPWAGAAAAPEDVTKHASCKHCGMDRGKFAHSRFVIEYDDGSSEGLCSLHCAALELAIAIDKSPKALRVADFGTKELIDAEAAQWVVGGDVAGVMTRRAKWAFQTHEAAQAFVKEHGGEVAPFEQAMKAAYEDTYEDTRMIREKRKMRRMKTPAQEGHGARQ